MKAVQELNDRPVERTLASECCDYSVKSIGIESMIFAISVQVLTL
jgi:hypothetical protein